MRHILGNPGCYQFVANQMDRASVRTNPASSRGALYFQEQMYKDPVGSFKRIMASDAESEFDEVITDYYLGHQPKGFKWALQICFASAAANAVSMAGVLHHASGEFVGFLQ